jgi:hypothetical protein
MTEKKRSVPKNTLEHPSMEGKYVVVGYEGVDPDEEITTILIFKIVKGKAVRIFGVEDFPEYQGSGDPGLSEQVLEKIREHKITELYQLSNTSGKDFKYLPKTKTFGINFFSKNIKINEETKEVDEWVDVSPYIKADDLMRDISDAGVVFRDYDVQTKEVN